MLEFHVGFKNAMNISKKILVSAIITFELVPEDLPFMNSDLIRTKLFLLILSQINGVVV